jgi:hypothetical protein
MANLPIQDGLVELSDVTSATVPVAVLSKEPDELTKQGSIQFLEGFDDLDYVTFAAFSSPSGSPVAFVRHHNAPSSGIEICVVPSNISIIATLKEVLEALKFSTDAFSWIHPAYEKGFRQASIV